MSTLPVSFSRNLSSTFDEIKGNVRCFGSIDAGRSGMVVRTLGVFECPMTRFGRGVFILKRPWRVGRRLGYVEITPQIAARRLNRVQYVKWFS